ncbi:hypothetical protein [Fimbriiglobus ruber]|uniref:Uncharacterized protein n=1 Tax=Fimbriiglobus ruber TaxID=1908690 RepID=A0A225CZZ4_9BACT|nr:hypothetical protein [Fimbriiglobus ruber]OWK34901.1 hypothetical protein FRUB_09743 [Fimbriiglobus ruber]
MYANTPPAENETATAPEFVPNPSEKKKPAISRVPLTTRIRSDYAAALKRASLERQLHGLEPSAILDILEDALEPWLKTRGYLS